MQLNVIGVKRVKGEGKESGLPYDICRIIALSPVEAVSTSKMQISGAGYEVAEMPLDTDALPKFLGLKFPVSLSLITDARPYRGKFETVVVGFEPIAK